MARRIYVLLCLCTMACLVSSCGNDMSIDAVNSTDILKDMTPDKAYKKLNSSTVLYIDASTVFLDAKQSPIFNAMKSQMYQYIGTLVFIKGLQFDTTECDRQKQTLFNALENMNSDYNYADIQKAVDNICNGNRQGMIISDFEFWKDGKPHDNDPYLIGSFKKWLGRGYQIDILTEPYYENRNLKKRFYMFFTDPTDKAPITNTMIEQVKNYLVKDNPNVGQCCLFTMKNSDVSIQRNKEKCSSSEEIDIDIKPINSRSELVSTEATWKDIKEFLMKLDNHNRVIEDENPIPIVDGLKLIDGTNYSVNDIKIRATNISKLYLSKQEGDPNLNGDTFDVSDAFDVELSPQKNISIFLNKNIFSAKHLYSANDGFDGNLIRIDIIADSSSINPYDETIFQWESVRNGKKTGKTATCVSLSIDNVLKDIEIVPDGKVIYTVYIQTPSYK